jgi:hypothetical protein
MQQMKKYLIMAPDGLEPLPAEVAKFLTSVQYPSLGVAREKTRAFWALFGVQLRIENVTASVKRKILS